MFRTVMITLVLTIMMPRALHQQKHFFLRVEEGLSRSFFGCGRKPLFPSTFAGGLIVFISFAFESESEVAQSCPTLFDPMDCSLPGSSIHGIFQARILAWVAISSSRGSSRPIPGSGRSPGEGNGNPLQYYCLENPMDREAW